MKKKWLIFTVFFGILLLGCMVVFFNQNLENRIINPEVSFSILYHDDVSHEEFCEFLRGFSIKNRIDVLQYVHSEDNEIVCYSTGIQWNKNMRLIKGKYPYDAYYISNVEQGKNCIGKVAFPYSEQIVKIYDFTYGKNTGYNTLFYVDSNNEDILELLDNEASKYGEIKWYFEEYSFVDMLRNNPLIICILVLLIALLLLLEVLLLVKEKQRMFIYDMLGIDRKEYLKYCYLKYVIPMWACMVLSILVPALIIMLDNSIFLLKMFDIIFMLCVLTLAMNVTFCLTYFCLQRNQYVKKTIQVGNKILYMAIYGLMLIILCNCLRSVIYWQHLRETDNWTKTRNIYRINCRWLGQKNMKEEDEINQDTLEFYRRIKKAYGAFIIDSTNYEYVLDKTGKQQYNYEMREDGVDENGPYGKCITVDDEYFKYNPIETPEGEAVQKYFVRDENTLNVLIPEQMYFLENDLRSQYLDYFYFTKIEVTDMYNQEKGIASSTETKDNLTINFIYTKKGSAYFTYNSETGDNKTHLIYDPMVIIYDEKVDASYLYAYATSSMYFKMDGIDNAYEILKTSMKNSNSMVIGGGQNVYAELGKTKMKLYRNMLERLVISQIIFVYIMIYSIFNIWISFEANRKYKMICYMLGYSKYAIFFHELIYIALPEVVIGIGVAAFMDVPYIIILVALIVLFQLLLLGVETEYLIRKEIHKKGKI